MLMRRVSSNDKIPDGRLRTAVASGAAVALATASLGVVGTAGASCINFSGIGIGEGAALHCEASFGNIAIVIGPTPADGEGSDAVAGNPSQFSFGNIAISVGSSAENFSNTSAGRAVAMGLPNIGNFSFATAGSSATTAGLINFAGSFGGTDSELFSAGVANSTLNIGSRNALASTGVGNSVLFLVGLGPAPCRSLALSA